MDRLLILCTNKQQHAHLLYSYRHYQPRTGCQQQKRRCRNNLNENLNYTFTNTNGNVFALNADHGKYHITGDQLQPNYYYNPSGTTVINSVIYQMMTPSDITINSVKADWDKNLKTGKISFGGKSSFVETDNDFQRYDVFTSGKVLDRDRSNRFRYKENINAGYLSYMRPFKTIMVQVGLRVENTNTNGHSTGLKNSGGTYVSYDSTFERHYTGLVPKCIYQLHKKPDEPVDTFLQPPYRQTGLPGSESV
jgi:iron complex outermembrane receptor protein